jgi:hypothetical protein
VPHKTDSLCKTLRAGITARSRRQRAAAMVVLFYNKYSQVGLGRIVALHDHSSTSYQIR